MGQRLDISTRPSRRIRGPAGGGRLRALLRGTVFTVLTGICLTLPRPAESYDNLSFKVAGPDKEALIQSLRSVSILSQLEGEEDSAPQDVLAAAQGDYARLVEALYAQGYYSAVVRILIDGREAATIPPFSAPDRIGKVQVKVDPGPTFTFGKAIVAPVNKRTPLPEGFARGEPARATVVRDTAQAAVDGWRAAGYAKAGIADQSITARHPSAELDVTLAVAKGRQFRFGDVLVTSESAVREGRIRQIAGIPRGKTFDPVEVEDAARRLALPISFLSGATNKLFYPESGQRTRVWLQDRNDRELYQQRIVPDYGHMDLFIGHSAHRDVTPVILEQLEWLDGRAQHAADRHQA